MTRVLSREGADARTSGQIYLAVVQVFIIYGSETWVMTPRIGRVLGRIPPQGGLQADGEATSERTVQSMGLPPS